MSGNPLKNHLRRVPLEAFDHLAPCKQMSNVVEQIITNSSISVAVKKEMGSSFFWKTT